MTFRESFPHSIMAVSVSYISKRVFHSISQGRAWDIKKTVQVDTSKLEGHDTDLAKSLIAQIRYGHNPISAFPPQAYFETSE